jgi:hypothetical protein
MPQLPRRCPLDKLDFDNEFGFEPVHALHDLRINRAPARRFRQIDEWVHARGEHPEALQEFAARMRREAVLQLLDEPQL